MGLLIAFIVLVVWGILRNSDLSGISNIIGAVLAIVFFWWLGSLFAPFNTVLSFAWSLSTVCAGFFYCIAIILAYNGVKKIFS